MTRADANSGLKGKQAATLAALLEKSAVAETAVAAGVSPATVYRYLRDDGFAAQYRAAKGELVALAVTRLQSDAAHAAKILRDIAVDGRAPASARVTAARAILEGAIKGAELSDLQAEVAAIKQLLAAKEGRGRGEAGA